MNDFAIRFVPLLFQTTLWLSGAALIAVVGLRTSRSNSSLAHRVVCVLTLLVGWTFVRFNLEIPWYAPASSTAVDKPAATAAVDGEPADQTQAVVTAPTLPVDDVSPTRLLPSGGIWDDAPALPLAKVDVAGSNVPHVLPDVETAQPPLLLLPPVVLDEPSLAALPPANREAEPVVEAMDVSAAPAVSRWVILCLALIALWALGMLLLALAWLVGYARFVRLVRRQQHEEPHTSWLAQWQGLLDAQAARHAIPLRITRTLGPMLCRLPQGYELLVPAQLWSELNPRERQAILRHELAHLVRGDVWKSLAMRVLALPHWFNPLAWWAVRRFDEAAEWACDLMAAGEQQEVTTYAKVLVRLGESLPASSAYGSSARGRSLAARVKRLLLEHQAEDSTMKKLLLASAGVCVLIVALVKVQLVAQEPPPRVRPDTDENAAAAVEATEQVAEPIDSADEGSVYKLRIYVGGRHTISKKPAKKIDIDKPKLVAITTINQFGSVELQALAPGVVTVTVGDVDDQTRTFEFTIISPDGEPFDERTTPTNAEPARDEAPPLVAEVLEAFGQGGAQDHPDVSRTVPPIQLFDNAAGKPAGNAVVASRQMLEAAQATYEAMMESYLAQTATGEQLFAWSNRWLNAELAVAIVPAMRQAAYEGHIKRMDDLLTLVQALHADGMKGGEASEYGPAQYYAADAKARLAQWEAQDVAPKAAAAPVKSSERTAPAAPPSERQSQAPAPPQPKPVALTTAERIWDVLGLRLEERPKESFTVGNAAVKEFVGGLVVTEVRSGTLADKAGIRPSNVLVEVSQNEGTGPGRPYKVTTLASLQELADDVLWHENSQLSIATLTKRKSDDEYWVHDWRLFPTVFRLMRTPAGGQAASGYTRSSYAIDAAALLWNKLRIEAESVPQQELRALLGEKAEYRKGLRITKAETLAQAPPWKVGDILVGIDEFEVGSLMDFVQIANRRPDRFDQQPPLSQILWFSLGNGGKYVMSLWESGKSAAQAEPAGREPIKATTGAPTVPPSNRQSQTPAPPQPKRAVSLTTAERIWDVLGLRFEERPKAAFPVGNAVVNEYSGGLVVTGVRGGTPADLAGIRPGNVLVEVSQSIGTVPPRPFKVTTLASLQELADDVIWQDNRFVHIAMLTKRKSDSEYWVYDWQLPAEVLRLMRTPASSSQEKSEAGAKPRPQQQAEAARPESKAGPQPVARRAPNKESQLPYVRVIYDSPELLLDVDDQLMSRADFFDLVRKNDWVAKKTFRHYQFDWSPDPTYIKQVEDLMKSMREMGVDYAYGWNPSLLVKISLNSGPTVYRQSYALAEAGTLSSMVDQAGGKLTDENLPQTIADISTIGKPTARILITDYSNRPDGEHLNELEKQDAVELAKSLEELGYRALIRMADSGPGSAAKPEQPSSNVPTPKADGASFEGRTFEEWQQFMRSDLSYQARIEGIGAMISFGQRDRAAEAARMVLGVLGDYNTRAWDHKEDAPYAELIGKAKIAFNSLPSDQVSNVLVEALSSENPNIRAFVCTFVPTMHLAQGIPKLVEIAHQSSGMYENERDKVISIIGHLAESREAAFVAYRQLLEDSDRQVLTAAIYRCPAMPALLGQMLAILDGDDTELAKIAERNLEVYWRHQYRNFSFRSIIDGMDPAVAKRAKEVLLLPPY